MKNCFFFALTFLRLTTGFAQEINCKVSISFDQVRVNQQATNAQALYAEMQSVMTDFINGRRWGTDNFAPEEKLNMTLSLVVQRATAQGDYEAQAQVQVTRPVFGTSYESVLLRFVDRNFQFNYLPDKPLNFNDNNYTDNLTSMLAFYAYVALAMDYDSFGKSGGNLFVQKAYNVTNLAQNSPYGGWDSRGDTRTRYWLAENLQNQQMQPFREGLYTYHRLALDTFNEQPDQARKQILDVLNAIKAVNQLRPATVLVNTFFDAKSDELVSIFSNASPADRKQAYALLSQLDPTKTDSYRKLNR